MPQPATHYLVTRRAIPQEYWSAWWDKYKPYFGLGSSAPDLFYFPMMPGIKNVSKEISWSELADPMHSSKSYDMFCTLLDIAKKINTLNPISSAKQFAFAFGYYCHVITDCIFHPYVYRSTHDHWSTNNYMNEAKHKMQEYIIDTGVFNKYYDKQNFSRLQWECNEGSQPLLDYSIAEQFNDALQTNYPDCYPLESDIKSEHHPIQQAYSALVQSIPTLFTGKKIYLFGANRIIDARKFNNEAQLRFFVSPYPNCDSLDKSTPEELFDYCASTCRRVFEASLQFWNSSSIDSKNYFKQHQTHYLNAGNWNLDTGLPSHYNNYVAMREENTEHYLFKANELKMTYEIIKTEYNASDYIQFFRPSILLSSKSILISLTEMLRTKYAAFYLKGFIWLITKMILRRKTTADFAYIDGRRIADDEKILLGGGYKMSLVLELQKESLDPNISTSDLLRKALVVARKLKLVEFQNWIEAELNGFTTTVPKYRNIQGSCMVKNPYHGYQPVQFPTEKMAKDFSRKAIGSTVAELEALIDERNSNKGILTSRYPAEIERQLSSQFLGLIPELVIGPDKIKGILDCVRNIVLDWALKIEEDGILGEGISFSESEKQKASHITNINYIGQMFGSQLQQGSNNNATYANNFGLDLEAVKDLTAKIVAEMDNMKIPPSVKAEIEADIATVNSQLNSPKPKEGIIRESLKSVRNILEGAAGSILSSPSTIETLSRLIGELKQLTAQPAMTRKQQIPSKSPFKMHSFSPNYAHRVRSILLKRIYLVNHEDDTL